MARLMRSMSLNDIQFDHSNMSAPSSARISSATAPPPIIVDDEGVNNSGNISDLHRLMYSACIEGDCIAAELLLAEDPNLCRDEISQEGDRALHLAVSMNHKPLVQKLVERMSPSDLELLDGNGHTACCFAALSGLLEIAHLLMTKNPTLATLRDLRNSTPLQKAIAGENASTVSYFMKFVKAQDLSTQEWFHLLLLSTSLGAYGVALQIFEMNEQVATMSNETGTALYLLAQQERQLCRSGTMEREMRLLAERLFAGIQKLGQSRAVELIKNLSILHYAAEVGNVELITMITHIYPRLVWHTGDIGCSIFHIAVKYRRENVFLLINEIGSRKDFIAAWRDQKGNTILHLVGESAHSKKDILHMPVLEMQSEMLWYERVLEIVPCFARGIRNNDGETAWELFLRRKSQLLEESMTWMRNVSGSCMLIATLLLSVVFASFFSVPGGYDQKTGIPTLFKRDAFSIYTMSGLLTALSAAASIICFANIMNNGMNMRHFGSKIPFLYVWGMQMLSASFFFSIIVLLSAFFLNYEPGSASNWALLAIVSYGCLMIPILVGRIVPPIRLRKQTRHTLFKQPHAN